MTGPGIAVGGGLPVLALAVAGLILFLLASWRGIWLLWLAGYLLTALALAASFILRDPVRTGDHDPILFVAPADGRVVAGEPVTGRGGSRPGRPALAEGIIRYEEEGSRVDQGKRIAGTAVAGEDAP